MSNNAFKLIKNTAESYNEDIRSYIPTENLKYKFNNPGFALISQRPNPDIDPLRVDTSGETWIWRKGMPQIHWDKLHVIPPLKELIKEFVFYKMQRVAYTTAANVAVELIAIQDQFRNPSIYPWSQENVINILTGLRYQYDKFYAFKEFYQWAAENQKAGFEEEIGWKIRNFRAFRSNEFIEYSNVKQRKHVLSTEEDRAIQKAIKYRVSEVYLPLLTDPEVKYTLEDVANWFGDWPMLPNAAKNDNTLMHQILKSYRALLKNQQALPIPIPISERKPSITGYIARVHYKAKDIIPKLRFFIIRKELIKIQSQIMTHIAYALGARPSQIIGINENSLIKYDVDGEIFYSIDIPSRKKRLTSKIKYSRNSGKSQVDKVSKRRKFPSEIGLGQKIEEYIRLKREAENIGVLRVRELREKPLFITDKRLKVFSDKRPLEVDVASAISNFLLKNGIKRNARALRSNVAQRIADAGYSAEIIAETLDHDSEKNIKFYVNATLKLSEIQDIALANHENYQNRMDELRGIKTINRKDINISSDVISGVVGGSLISAIGVCEKKRTGVKACANEPIYSCYAGCPAFNPFDEINIHKKVLNNLRSDVIENMESDENNEPIRLALTNKELIANVVTIIKIIEEQNS